jgi:hypothetical protein
MKKTDWFYNAAISAVAIGIIAVFVFKFVLPDKPQQDGFAVREFEKITVIDLSRNELQLADLVSKDLSTYCFLFEMTNCYSCIFQGIEDLKKLKAAGKPCVALAVHHLIDEVAGWSANYDFSPFFMLEKHNFYEHIHTPVMPVMIKIKNGKVETFRYIQP